MSTFQLWDVPSASLIDENDDLQKIVKTVQALIDEDGPGVLDDLSLSEARGDTGQFVSVQGRDIMHSLHDHLVTGSATSGE